VIDVKDVADFAFLVAENRLTGIYNTDGLEEQLTFFKYIEGRRDA
jgi:hypothetical protein